MNMRRISLSLAGALALGALVSCGDSGSGSSGEGGSGNGGSGSSSGDVKRSVEIDGDTIRYAEERSAKVFAVDASARLFSVASPVEQYCVLEGASVSWKAVKEYPDTTTLSWSFAPVTTEMAGILKGLGYDVDGKVLLVLEEAGDDDQGDLLLGGDSSSVFGEWTYTPCYTDASGGFRCSNRHVEGSLKIGKSSMTRKASNGVAKGDYLYDDPFGSRFMSLLYDNLAGGNYYAELEAEDLFREDTGAVARSVANDGVEILDRAKKSQTFKIGLKTYTVEVLKSSGEFQKATGGFDYSAVVEVAGESETCRIEVRSVTVVGESLCDDGNMDAFKWDEDQDVDGNAFEYADGIVLGDAAAHEACLKRIAAIGPDASAP